jgi:Uma2 family endonuclease
MRSSPAVKLNEHYTWSDYQTWPEGERWELINGEAFDMSPSPTVLHQDISGALLCLMRPYFRGKKCMLVSAPMDVKLSDIDVVQPDLLVVCDPKQIKNHIEGPPALVVEILSESSIDRDRVAKTKVYAKFGVKEYWIVTSLPGVVEVFQLQGDRYLLWKAFGQRDTLTSPGFPDLRVKLKDVFDFPVEPQDRKLTRIKEPPARYATKTRPATHQP